MQTPFRYYISQSQTEADFNLPDLISTSMDIFNLLFSIVFFSSWGGGSAQGVHGVYVTSKGKPFLSLKKQNRPFDFKPKMVFRKAEQYCNAPLPILP